MIICTVTDCRHNNADAQCTKADLIITSEGCKVYSPMRERLEKTGVCPHDIELAEKFIAAAKERGGKGDSSNDIQARICTQSPRP